jgi:hypothetical protein
MPDCSGYTEEVDELFIAFLKEVDSTGSQYLQEGARRFLRAVYE